MLARNVFCQVALPWFSLFLTLKCCLPLTSMLFIILFSSLAFLLSTLVFFLLLFPFLPSSPWASIPPLLGLI